MKSNLFKATVTGNHRTGHNMVDRVWTGYGQGTKRYRAKVDRVYWLFSFSPGYRGMYFFLFI